MTPTLNVTDLWCVAVHAMHVLSTFGQKKCLSPILAPFMSEPFFQLLLSLTEVKHKIPRQNKHSFPSVLSCIAWSPLLRALIGIRMRTYPDTAAELDSLINYM